MKGNKNGAKYSEEQIREIRRLYEVEGLSCTNISNITGISVGYVDSIVKYRRWKDLR